MPRSKITLPSLTSATGRVETHSPRLPVDLRFEFSDGTELSPALAERWHKDGKLPLDLASVERERERRARHVKHGRVEERAAGLLPKRGGQRKNFGPREANGRASRRKADVSAANNWSKVPDALWDLVVLGRGGAKSIVWRGHDRLRFPSPADPLFLNLARRGELDLESFAKALLWWATKRYWTENKHLLFKVICGKKVRTDGLWHKRDKLDAQSSNERRQIALRGLGDEFVGRLDAAIFEDKISDAESLKRDLAAVWQSWCSAIS